MASLVFLLFLLYEASSETELIQVVPVKPVGPVVPVKPGQDATLPCDAGDASIRAVEWTRSDPQPSQDILFWSDGHSYTPYEGRVQLVDGELKNGDVSLILKNVSREDVGTYECRVVTAGSGRNKRAISDSDPISTVQLQVTGDITPLRVGLGAAGVLFCSAVVVVGLLVMKSKRQRDKKPEPSAGEETGDVNLL